MERILLQNDSRDTRSQRELKALKLLDFILWECYHSNKRESDDVEYEPQIVIYIGHLEYDALMGLSRNNPELTDGLNYRGFPVTHVVNNSHCRVFCLNPPVRRPVLPPVGLSKFVEN